MDDEFKNEVFSSYEPHLVRSCNVCGGKAQARADNVKYSEWANRQHVQVQIRSTNLV